MPAEKRNAYLTVYLALTMGVLLSLFLALLEGARSNAVYMEAECVTDIGLNSILAEYHRELLRQYNLFAIDSSYGSVKPGAANTQQHLSDYIERNLSREDVMLEGLLYRDFLGMSLGSADIDKVSVLTDGEGALFRKRAAEAVKDDIGLNLYQELTGWMREVEVNKMAERDIAAEKSALDGQLLSYNGKKVKVSDEEDEDEEIEDKETEDGEAEDGEEDQISEEDWVTVEVNNPTEVIEEQRRLGILKHVADDPAELSSRTMYMGNLISERIAAGKVNKGNIKLPEQTSEEQLLERFFFQEYLLRYMGNYRKQSEEDALRYQIEYLIAGQENDTDNLRSTANTLCAIREVANTIYLYSDSAKRATAEALGTVLATAMLIPEAAEVVAGILILGWAYAESLYDVECLFAGGRVPLIKDSETWHYSLEAALIPGGERGSLQDKGLSYEDYLRVLMMLKDEDTLTTRAMNMVEADIRQTKGNKSFRLDGCIDCVEANVFIESAYGYDCVITRQKGYSTQ